MVASKSSSLALSRGDVVPRGPSECISPPLQTFGSFPNFKPAFWALSIISWEVILDTALRGFRGRGVGRRVRENGVRNRDNMEFFPLLLQDNDLQADRRNVAIGREWSWRYKSLQLAQRAWSNGGLGATGVWQTSKSSGK
jgi:hypothetical protein